MCTICVTFTPHMPDCAYRALGVLPPDAEGDPGADASMDTTGQPTSTGQSTFAPSTVSEGADAAASTATAYTMLVTDTFVGDLSTAGDRDWIAIDLTAGESYVFTVNGAGSPALTDGILRLRDGNGDVIGVNDDAGAGLNPALGFTADSTGTYYIDVGGYQDIRTGGYSLGVTSGTPTAPFGSHDELATYLTDGFWEDFSSSAHAFDTTLTSTLTVDISRLTADGQRLAQWALQAFEQVIDLTFNVVTVPGTFDPSDAQFNPYLFADITFYDDDPGAFASFVADGNGNTQRAWVNVSTDWLSSNGTEINDYAFQTYLHEIGHALGLGHQGNYNGGATFGTDNTFSNDSWLVSVMSYFHQDESLYTGSAYAAVISPMLVDVIALQGLYGAPSSTDSPTTGDTVYGVGHTFAAAFAGTDLNTYGSYLAAAFDYISTGSDPNGYFDATTIAFTITDAGGSDLIDFSTDLFNQVVSLMDETLSTVFNPLDEGRNDNMWIARGTVIENYRAGLGDDSVMGNDVANEITGNDGNDTIFGAQGNDQLFGGSGDDSLDGGDGADTLEGGQNADLIRGGFGADSLRGDGGADILHGGAGADTIIGGDGDDWLYGDQSTDLLIGGTGADTMDGGAETDTYYVTTGDRITDTGLGGYDRAQVTETAGQFLNLEFWTGIERVNGNSGNDTIDASASTDDLVLFGAQGSDSLMGGAGNDTLLGGSGNDILIGGDGENILFGEGGDDTYTGGDGNDLFYIDSGGDSVTDGGGGFDRALVNNADGVSVTVGSWTSVERISGFTGDDTIDATGATEAKVLLGKAGNDVLTGGTQADILLGGDGNDVLTGGGGNDTLQGGTGNDTFFGGAGDDRFFLGDSGDVVSDGGTGFDIAIINNATGISLDIGGWTSVEQVNGWTGNDTIDATGAANAIIMDAGAGADSITGGEGNDTVYAGDGADVLIGAAGDDALIGSGGNDTIHGGAGDDFLLGGADADTFSFSTGFGSDVIADFTLADIMDFTAHGDVTALSDLSFSNDGTHTLITLTSGGSDEITLANFTGNLGNDDFIFT